MTKLAEGLRQTGVARKVIVRTSCFKGARYTRGDGEEWVGGHSAVMANECPLLMAGRWGSKAGGVSGAAGYVDLFYFLGRDAVPLGYGAADGALHLLGDAAVLSAAYYGH